MIRMRLKILSMERVALMSCTSGQCEYIQLNTHCFVTYIKNFVIEVFVIRVLHCTYIRMYMSVHECTVQVAPNMNNIQLNTHLTNQKFRGNLFVISRSLLHQDNFLRDTVAHG